VCPGDFDVNLVVNYADLDIFTDNWLRNDCNIPDWCSGTDLDLTYAVDFFDFAIFAENWLKEI
jgi:hypothetical protein